MYENIRAGMIKEAKTGVMKKDGGEKKNRSDDRREKQPRRKKNKTKNESTSGETGEYKWRRSD